MTVETPGQVPTLPSPKSGCTVCKLRACTDPRCGPAALVYAEVPSGDVVRDTF